MRKQVLIIAMLCLYVSGAFAQNPPFNTTLTHPNFDFYHGDFALPAPQGEFVVGAYAVDPGTGDNKYTLSRFGPTGNYIPPTVVRDSSYNLDCITETNHGSFTGFVVASELVDHLLVSKYDLSMNQIWSVRVNKSNPMQFVSVYAEVDIEVERDGAGNDLNYYIVFTSGPNDPTYDQDNCLSVVKMDINGAVAWHKTYSDVNRSGYEWYQVLRDKAYSITSFPDPNDPGQNLYAIAGDRIFFNLAPSPSTFYMVIDPAGNIVTQYTDITTHSPHYYPDIVYDGDSLAISFLQTNVNNEPSAYGIMKTDIGLSSFRGQTYINECENYAHSISFDGTDYIIGGWAGPCSTTTPYQSNTSLLRISQTSLAAVDYKRFNVYQEVLGNRHKTELSSGDNFITGFTNNAYSAWGTRGLRITKTDNTFSTCGATDLDVETFDLEPDDNQREYEAVDYYEWEYLEVPTMDVDLYQDYCVEDGSQDYYKPGSTAVAHIAGINNATVAINPTAVKDANTPVMCTINTEVNMEVTIDVYNVSGQILSSEKQNIAAGETAIRVNTSNITAGMHFVRVKGDNKLLLTQKVSFLN